MNENGRRRGRPCVENPKNILRGFRFDAEENELLNRLSNETGKSEPEIVRKALMLYATALDLK